MEDKLIEFTTVELSAVDVKEKDKAVISNDSYAVCSYLNKLIKQMRIKV